MKVLSRHVLKVNGNISCVFNLQMRHGIQREDTMPRLQVVRKNSMLLNGDGQVHSRVNGAIKVKCSGRSKWTDGSAIVAIECFVDSGGAIFRGGLLCVALPAAINNDMSRRGIVNEVEHITFMESNRRLNEGGSAHMDSGIVGGIGSIYYGACAQ